MYGAEILAMPDESVTGFVAGWPSLKKVTVPVGCGLPGETVAVKVKGVPGAMLAAERFSEVVLGPCVEPVTMTTLGSEVDGA